MPIARVDGYQVSVNPLISWQAGGVLFGNRLTDSFSEFGFDLRPRHNHQLY